MGYRIEKLPIIHPGHVLKGFLDDYGLSEYRLARDIHVPPRRINEIIHGKRGISVDTALRLSAYFGNSPQFWMNAQQTYEIAKAQKEIAPRIARQVQRLSA